MRNGWQGPKPKEIDYEEEGEEWIDLSKQSESTSVLQETRKSVIIFLQKNTWAQP